MKDEFRALTLEWIKKAESDFKFAKASFDEFDDFYSQMCILCHDAAEKFLKAYIIAFGAKPGRIHDLVALLNDCKSLTEDSAGLSTLEETCRILNRYYTPLKYPSHYPIMTKQQAREAIDCAGFIAKEISNRLNMEPSTNKSQNESDDQS